MQHNTTSDGVNNPNGGDTHDTGPGGKGKGKRQGVQAGGADAPIMDRQTAHARVTKTDGQGGVNIDRISKQALAWHHVAERWTSWLSAGKSEYGDWLPIPKDEHSTAVWFGHRLADRDKVCKAFLSQVFVIPRRSHRYGNDPDGNPVHRLEIGINRAHFHHTDVAHGPLHHSGTQPWVQNGGFKRMVIMHHWSFPIGGDGGWHWYAIVPSGIPTTPTTPTPPTDPPPPKTPPTQPTGPTTPSPGPSTPSTPTGPTQPTTPTGGTQPTSGGTGGTSPSDAGDAAGGTSTPNPHFPGPGGFIPTSGGGVSGGFTPAGGFIPDTHDAGGKPGVGGGGSASGGGGGSTGSDPNLPWNRPGGFGSTPFPQQSQSNAIPDGGGEDAMARGGRSFPVPISRAQPPPRQQNPSDRMGIQSIFEGIGTQTLRAQEFSSRMFSSSRWTLGTQPNGDTPFIPGRTSRWALGTPYSPDTGLLADTPTKTTGISWTDAGVASDTFAQGDVGLIPDDTFRVVFMDRMNATIARAAELDARARLLYHDDLGIVVIAPFTALTTVFTTLPTPIGSLRPRVSLGSVGVGSDPFTSSFAQAADGTWSFDVNISIAPAAPPVEVDVEARYAIASSVTVPC